LISLLVVEGKKPGKYDQLAQCITDSGAKFYGAFWCPHCQAQKAMFGKSAKKLPYVECSTKDGKGQTQICIDQDIKSYPTWVLADGTRLPVENQAGVSFATLAAKTNCTVPTE
jgi:thiol-disulfide isomerase/thioredoxin